MQINHWPRAGKIGLFCFLFFLGLSSLAQGANYYITQTGAGSHNGSLGNEWDVATFNASNVPTGGDTVYFSGIITTTVTPNTSGTGNGSSRLTLDFSQATLNTANPRINMNRKTYLNINGGTFGTASTGSLISFNGSQSHDVTIQNWTHTGTVDSVAGFIYGQYAYNLTVSGNTIDSVANFIWGDTIYNHDITISNNYCRTSLNTATQTDIVSFGDAYNVTIQGNKFIQRTEGATAGRHNDVIQSYRKGGSASGTPYGWVIRYNWIELNVATGSGDTSWLMLESMANVGGVAACKIYENVFVGRSGTVSNNGMAPNSNDSSAVFYFYNNTVVLKGSTPENTIRFLSPGTVYAANNIGYANASPGTSLSWTMTKGGDWNYNFFYHFNSCTASYSGASGSCTTLPLFTDYAGDEFSVSSSSKLRGAGINLGPEYDQGIAEGARWPNPSLVQRTGNWDIGAYQSTSISPPSNLRILSP